MIKNKQVEKKREILVPFCATSSKGLSFLNSSVLYILLKRYTLYNMRTSALLPKDFSLHKWEIFLDNQEKENTRLTIVRLSSISKWKNRKRKLSFYFPRRKKYIIKIYPMCTMKKPKNCVRIDLLNSVANEDSIPIVLGTLFFVEKDENFFEREIMSD